MPWSTTRVAYRWPLRYATSSIPMRLSPARRSIPARAASTTRVTILVTLCQEIRSSLVTADADVWAASHATVSSNAVVNRAWRRAHGTLITVGPCIGQSTLGTSASITTFSVPKSRCRHRRRPQPRSYHGARAWQRSQRRAAPLCGRAQITSTSPSASSSRRTSSTTARSVLPVAAIPWSNARRFPTSRFRVFAAQKPRRDTACAVDQGPNPPTRTSQEPN